MRRLLSVFCLILAAVATWRYCDNVTQGQPKREVEAGAFWIWSPDATLQSAPEGSRFFRRTFEVKGAVKEALLDITADNHFTVWINGTLVGSGDEWQRIERFKVTKTLQAGKNIIAVEGRNDDASPAGLLATLTFTDESGKQTVTTDKSWKSAQTVTGDKWKKADFDDAKWEAAKQLAPFGGGPWASIGGSGTKPTVKPGFTVPEGFKVETIIAPGTKIDGEANAKFKISFVNMCFDAKGRLLLSQEGGPIVLAAVPNKDGVFQKLLPYCEQVKNCHGMCWIHGALYLVGDGPKGTGLYRCRDTKKADKIDEVEQIFKFQGGMGEHGPHAVIHGPDDKLYVVIGNHASAIVPKLAANSPLTRWPDGQQGPDQGKPGTTEDVLLPRLNDANGHAANIRAPGGTIWRLDLDGKNPALVAAGFRNHFDAAFNPDGELFTFDSDMEWDEGLPWYRHVRVCHCIPGADFLWRTGAANTPNYYADSLPPLYETGRGSPTGVEFYDHSAFPSKYRGAFFMCDWSIGVLWAVHLKRDGATYKATAEKFCTGAPMPITDCAVGPEGAMYFSLGGRGTQGSVQRIVYAPENPQKRVGFDPTIQMLAPFIREPWAHEFATNKGEIEAALIQHLKDPKRPGELLQADLRFARMPGVRLTSDALKNLAGHKDAEVRAAVLPLIDVGNVHDAQTILPKLLKDDDALVRRRACEALIRLGIEPSLKDLKPLLADKDQFVRTAARLVLQRIDPAKWANDLLADNPKTDNAGDLAALQAIIALCKIGRTNDYAEKIVDRLSDSSQIGTLDWLRTTQLALVHCKMPRNFIGSTYAVSCRDLFPQNDRFVNRELAILLAHFASKAKIDDLTFQNVVSKLMKAIRDSSNDRPQQIHYFYCLRVIKNGWTPQLKADLLTWFESTRTWTGGASYSGFLQNILRDMFAVWTPAERKALIEQFDKMPLTALTFVRFVDPKELPEPAKLLEMFKQVAPNNPKGNELKTAFVEAIARTDSPDKLAVLRKLADTEPAYKLAAIRVLARYPKPENLHYLIQAVNASPGGTVGEFLDALKKSEHMPKPDDAKAYRAVLLSAAKLPPDQKWKVVEVLRAWTNGRSFGGEKKTDWKSELGAWGKWFAQAYPKEESLPDVTEEKVAESKWKYADLLAYLEKDPRGIKGDPVKGKAVFTKANCIKCHKYGTEGEGIGPDLTTLSKRFKRGEVLESILFPSKVISDQYRSSTILTLDGRSFSGLAAEQGGTITILLQDGTKVSIKAGDVETRYASLVSVMPEKLLDELTREEIADLFAYTESPVPEKK